MLAKNHKIQRIVGRSRWLRGLAIGLSSRVEAMLLGTHKDPATMRLLRKIRSERESLMTTSECYLLYSIACAQSALPGEMAEVGTYQGCSAKILCEAKGATPLHLFDTFAGLPEPDAEEQAVLERSQFAASREAVASYLEPYDSVSLHAGRFPESGAPVTGKTFSLVHLDVDLYGSTLAGLEFFYPRLCKGGAIVSHDYSILDGVHRAFDEFTRATGATVIELPTTQCLLVRH